VTESIGVHKGLDWRFTTMTMVHGIAHLGTTPQASLTSFVVLGLGFVAVAVVAYDAYREHWC